MIKFIFFVKKKLHIIADFFTQKKTTMNCLAKISELFVNHDFSNFIERINQKATIVGVSVVYALNEFVPKDSVNVIDIITNDKDFFVECLEYLKTECVNIKFSYV